MIACLVVLSSTHSTADSIADGAKAAASLASKISYVASGGIWEHDGRFGRYRLIVVTEGVEHAGTYAYAQWLSIEESTHEIEEVATVPIDSLNPRSTSENRPYVDVSKPAIGDALVQLGLDPPGSSATW